MKNQSKATWANKISTVKCKGDNPKFEQQQVPNGDGSKKKWKHVKCTGKKQKEKQAASSQPHTHIALVIYTSSPEPVQDPRALTHHPTTLYQEKGCPPFHIGIQEAFTLAHWLEIPASIETIGSLDSGLTTHGPSFLSSTVCLLSPFSSFNILASFSTVTLDSPLLLTKRLKPIYKSESDSPPPIKHSKCFHRNEIMAPPTNHWNKEDFINIYGSDASNEDEGFPRMCSSVSLCPHTPYDPLMAALVPTASSHINMCGSVCSCNENHCICMKCAHRHEDFKNHWILDSSASMHFIPLRDVFTSYHKFSKKEHLPVQTTAATIFVEGKGTICL